MNKKKSKDTYNYKGWLVSDYFFKRLLAFTGYTIIISLIWGLFMFSLMPLIFKLFEIPI